MKQLLAALHERHGLDRDTVAAMAFERSRQQNVSLTQALTDLVAELDHVPGSNAPARAVPDDGVEVMGRVFRSAKDVADAIVESQRHGQRQDE